MVGLCNFSCELKRGLRRSGCTCGPSRDRAAVAECGSIWEYRNSKNLPTSDVLNKSGKGELVE